MYLLVFLLHIKFIDIFFISKKTFASKNDF